MMKNNFMKKRCIRDNNFLSRFSSSSNLSLRNFALYRRLVRSQDQADKQRGSMNRKLEGKEFERIVTSGARSETKFPRFERKKRKEEEEEAREQRERRGSVFYRSISHK